MNPEEGSWCDFDWESLLENQRRCIEQHMEIVRERGKKRRKVLYRQNRSARLEKSRKWREANKPRQAETNRRWRHNNPERLRENASRRRALKKSAVCDSKGVILAHKKLVLESDPHCFYCAKTIPLQKLKGKVQYHWDHAKALVDGGSHTIDNLVLSCPKCNLRKGTRHSDEFLVQNGRLPLGPPRREDA